MVQLFPPGRRKNGTMCESHLPQCGFREGADFPSVFLIEPLHLEIEILLRPATLRHTGSSVGPSGAGSSSSAEFNNSRSFARLSSAVESADFIAVCVSATRR